MIISTFQYLKMHNIHYNQLNSIREKFITLNSNTSTLKNTKEGLYLEETGWHYPKKKYLLHSFVRFNSNIWYIGIHHEREEIKDEVGASPQMQEGCVTQLLEVRELFTVRASHNFYHLFAGKQTIVSQPRLYWMYFNILH